MGGLHHSLVAGDNIILHGKFRRLSLTTPITATKPVREEPSLETASLTRATEKSSP